MNFLTFLSVFQNLNAIFYSIFIRIQDFMCNIMIVDYLLFLIPGLVLN